jgi:RNA recognition motif-containing protein
MRDKESGKSRAFGFVTFACSFMAEAALEAREHIINDRKIEPRLAQPGKNQIGIFFLNRKFQSVNIQVYYDEK